MRKSDTHREKSKIKKKKGGIWYGSPHREGCWTVVGARDSGRAPGCGVDWGDGGRWAKLRVRVCWVKSLFFGVYFSVFLLSYTRLCLNKSSIHIKQFISSASLLKATFEITKFNKLSFIFNALKSTLWLHFLRKCDCCFYSCDLYQLNLREIYHAFFPHLNHSVEVHIK